MFIEKLVRSAIALSIVLLCSCSTPTITNVSPPKKRVEVNFGFQLSKGGSGSQGLKIAATLIDLAENKYAIGTQPTEQSDEKDSILAFESEVQQMIARGEIQGINLKGVNRLGVVYPDGSKHDFDLK